MTYENVKKEPLIRVAKRPELSSKKAILVRLLSVVVALILGGLLVLALGHNPIAVYGDIIKGSLLTPTALKSTVKIAVPLLGAALAIAPAFKMKFWNCGAEGQITVGAIVATYFALFHVDDMPPVLLFTTAFIGAALAGGLWGLIPAFFKARWGTNETLFTLMLNYIAIGFVKYLRIGPWMDKGQMFPKIPMFDKAARLPEVFGVHIGWIIVLALVFSIYIYMTRTKHGYEIAVVGESVSTARYSGMNVAKVIMRTMFLSGAIAGIVGWMMVCGTNYTLSDTTANGYGFTAIVVAWLSKLNPFTMVIISAFLAVLQKGSNTIQTNFGIPASASDVLTGLILLCMLGSEFFINYRFVFRKKTVGGDD
ncbi:MAG: ABC transporter permease [Oscillospiraceae bacterium]|nr:ABC transporter permease [Oscillospiraceae bacterium]MBQ6700017.1 ABC transporter permease [Oscillospiraceae bacterium]MBQ6801940.1 ABC transporter permease [Oscillospiraceae bacterium]